jgi:hypothetical protein
MVFLLLQLKEYLKTISYFQALNCPISADGKQKEYGGIRIDQAKRLKALEQENARLKKIVADLSIDNSILKEASRGNY